MSQPSRLQAVEEIPYPPPPWKMNGQMWMGYFKTDAPVQLPSGLQPLLDPCSLIVVVVRYLEGTLQYDELAFGVLTRLGSRMGIYIDYIWVDSLASVWGGLWMPTPGIGQLENGAWVFTQGDLWARMGRSGLQIKDWPNRFGYRPVTDKPSFSFGAKPFRLTVPAGKVITDGASSG